MLQTTTSNFVQAGLAFGRIREKQLHRMEYQSFDTYCRIKWQYGRRYVDQMIFAAQVYTTESKLLSQNAGT